VCQPISPNFPAAGNHKKALTLLRTMAKQTSQAGMIPEQVWDQKDIPRRFLFNGHPAGSGMPLVWAHSEYIKLLRSLHERAIWDLPTQTVDRYLKQRTSADFPIWTTKQRRAWLASGKNLRIDLEAAATLEWTCGKEKGKVLTSDTGFGLHTAMLALSHLPPKSTINVTIVTADDRAHLKRDSFRLQVRPG
jgi:glucoamylase